LGWKFGQGGLDDGTVKPPTKGKGKQQKKLKRRSFFEGANTFNEEEKKTKERGRWGGEGGPNSGNVQKVRNRNVGRPCREISTRGGSIGGGVSCFMCKVR